MKKQLSILLLLFSLVLTASAQEKETFKFGEFGSLWACDYVIAITDNFLLTLQENPKAKGFIFVYEGKYAEYTKHPKTKFVLPRRGEAAFRTQIIRNHIKLRKFDLDRILFIDGGFREEQNTEFWIVPEGAEIPKSTPTLDRTKYRKGIPDWRCDI